ncbi:MAG: aminodeoxychorismate lyase [Arenimonas sp.]
MTSKVVNLVGNSAELASDDRGLAYGDGLFETILVHAGELVWWNEHWQRLTQGAGVLKIQLPDEAIILNACNKLLEKADRCVLKIILTRGSGGRGYAVPEKQDPRIIISVHPAPSPISEPVNLRWCETQLACQPVLAGIKHLNRLEQVLARNEWQDENVFEGLMCDAEGNVVCATSANVFVKIEGRWLTPKIDRAGIAGIARAWVLKQWPQVQEARLSRLQIGQAEAVFICNAVRGILAVKRLEDREYPVDGDILGLQSQLAKEQAAFAMGEHSGS